MRVVFFIHFISTRTYFGLPGRHLKRNPVPHFSALFCILKVVHYSFNQLFRMFRICGCGCGYTNSAAFDFLGNASGWSDRHAYACDPLIVSGQLFRASSQLWVAH